MTRFKSWPQKPSRLQEECAKKDAFVAEMAKGIREDTAKAKEAQIEAHRLEAMQALKVQG